jgi:hypothetical protein
VKIPSVSRAGCIAGFRGRHLINPGVTTNARRGPGVLPASVRFYAGIISARFIRRWSLRRRQCSLSYFRATALKHLP